MKRGTNPFLHVMNLAAARLYVGRFAIVRLLLKDPAHTPAMPLAAVARQENLAPAQTVQGMGVTVLVARRMPDTAEREALAVPIQQTAATERNGPPPAVRSQDLAAAVVVSGMARVSAAQVGFMAAGVPVLAAVPTMAGTAARESS